MYRLAHSSKLRNYVKDVRKNSAFKTQKNCALFVFSLENYKF